MKKILLLSNKKFNMAISNMLKGLIEKVENMLHQMRNFTETETIGTNKIEMLEFFFFKKERKMKNIFVLISKLDADEA